MRVGQPVVGGAAARQVIAGPLLTGGGVGFSIAAPVGPIGALTIRRTLAQGRLIGFLTGLGAATADAAYGAVAAFGLTLVTDVLLAQQLWLRLGGGLFLLYLGIQTFRARPAPLEQSVAASGLLAAYASTFLLTLANPTTILSFVAIFAGLGPTGAAATTPPPSLFVLGVFLGSALWWLLLSSGVGLLRGRLDQAALRWVNRVSGALITAFGFYALSGLFWFCRVTTPKTSPQRRKGAETQRKQAHCMPVNVSSRGALRMTLRHLPLAVPIEIVLFFALPSRLCAFAVIELKSSSARRCGEQ